MPDLVERDYARTPLTAAEGRRLVAAFEDLGPLINTRHALAKAGGWAARAPSRAAFVRALVEDPNVLRRPVILRGDRGLVSRDAAEIRAFLKG